MLHVRKFTVYVLCLGASLWGMQLAQASHLPGFVDLVKETSSAVVNISTKKSTKLGKQLDKRHLEIPELPNGGPMDELLRHFFGGDRLPFGLDQLPEDLFNAESLGWIYYF